MPKRRPWIYAPGPEEAAARAAAARAARVAERFGVFRWEPENMYRTSDALRVYKMRHAAESFADRENSKDPTANLVVRPLR